MKNRNIRKKGELIYKGFANIKAIGKVAELCPIFNEDQDSLLMGHIKITDIGETLLLKTVKYELKIIVVKSTNE